MDFDPKKDVRLQEILAAIVSSADLSKNRAPAKDRENEGRMISDLGRLRVEFFWTNCFSDLYDAESRRRAYVAYKAVRDTPDAQRYTRDNPSHLANIDLSLCRVANSIRKEWGGR